jgi:EmrB/QacA subfamily drug resistance transporter
MTSTRARRRHARTVVAVLAVAVAGYTLLQSLLNPVLVTLQHDLNTTQAATTWVITAYLLSASICTPIVGRLGDLLGKRRMFLVAAGALVLGSLIDALAPSITVVIVGRIVQGVGGGLLPLAFGIIRDEVPPERVAPAISLMASLIGVGSGVGVVLAGPIVDILDYHWLFWIPLVIVAVAAVGVALVIDESPIRADARFNPTAAVLMAGWLSALLLTLSEGASWGWASAPTLLLALATVVLLLTWLAVERSARHPLVDLRMMRLPGVWPTNLVALLAGADMYAAYAFLPQFAQTPPSAGYGFAATVTEAGLIMLPASAATLVLGLVNTWLTRLLGAKSVVVGGSLLTAVAMLMLICWHANAAQAAAAAAVLGVGIGVAFGSLTTLIVQAVAVEQTGVAGGMNANIRTIGGSIGTTLFATVLATTAGGRASGAGGYDWAFGLLALLALLGAAVGLLVPGDRTATAVQNPRTDSRSAQGAR